MGFAIAAYLLLAISGIWMFVRRRQQKKRPTWLYPFHLTMGIAILGLVLLLLGIGIVGTLGHYGSLGHSFHLVAGLTVVNLVALSVWSAVQISPANPWARPFHVSINLGLLVAFILVSLTGWDVVQKYLPS